MSDSEDGDKGIIAERLDKLFTTMTPEGRPYSLREAAEGINKQAGRDVVTFQYLSHLRSGQKKNPSYEKLQAIANWFGVNVEYFSSDEVARRTDEEIRILTLMRDRGVRHGAFRLAGLSPKNMKFALDMLDKLRANDGLPPAEADAPSEGPSAASGPESETSV